MYAPVVRLDGMADFNSPPYSHIVRAFDGWLEPPTPRGEMVATGRAGAVPVGPWDAAEAYYLLQGSIACADKAAVYARRGELLAALPANADKAVKVLDAAAGVDRQAFVRRYDKPELTVLNRELRFGVPLVGLDPYKYGVEPVQGVMGVFTGQSWFREYDTLGYYREYDALAFTRRYLQQELTGPFPPASELTSPGTATSRRLVVEATGPLTAGDWWVLNEATGERMWIDLSLQNGQTAVFDCWRQTVTLNGASVDHLMHGDFLTFEPGPNVYRLVSGTQSEGFASLISALPAYE